MYGATNVVNYAGLKYGTRRLRCYRSGSRRVLTAKMSIPSKEDMKTFHPVSRLCFAGSILFALLTFAPQLFATEPGQTQHLSSADAVPEGLSKTEWSNIRAAYEAKRHEAVAVEDGYQARNPGQQWLTKFDGHGFLTQPDQGGWQWGLELSGYGFTGREQRLNGEPEIKAEGQRVTYKWKQGISEWYVNDERGLEHGYTIEQRPAGSEGAESLEFELKVRGNLRPEIADEGVTVRFMDGATNVVNYAGLKVRDAAGKNLRARFVVTGNDLRLEVDERGAHYPITIDPIAQQAYLKASNTDTDISDYFGSSVAVSGNTVVVGAIGESSNATGVNGDQTDNSARYAGAVYVFVRSGSSWSQQAYLKASNTDESDYFGGSVAVSGNIVVVGAIGESSNAVGVNGDGSDNSVQNSGAAYVFVRNGSSWSQQAYLKASNTDRFDQFGNSVAVSANTVVVGVAGDSSAHSYGAAYVFVRSGSSWSQQAYLTASNSDYGDQFGHSVAISGDTMVMGAVGEDSNATGVNGNGSDNSASNSGAAYVFVRNGSSWSQQAYLKASNTDANDQFGNSVAISGDTVVVGANAESSNATGINGNEANNSVSNSGAAYVFVRSGSSWSQQAYLKASSTDAFDQFGNSVAISGDTVLVGAPGESSNATGINGNASDNSVADSGAAYVFVRNGSSWSQQAYLKASSIDIFDGFGVSVAISGDTVVVGVNGEDSNATGVNGNASDNSASNSGAAYIFAFPSSTLGNISTRGLVGTGDNVLIGGTIVSGDRPIRALFRARGPSLAAFQITNSLQNPQLDIHDGNGTLIAHNDNWQEEPDGTANATRAAQITSTGLAPSDPRESAILLTLQPGNYTAIVSGVSGTTGLGLVEAYGLGAAP
jgi:hypothetical protein